MKIKTLLLAVAATSALAAGSANALTYTYVGSWTLGTGVSWTTNPPVYSGQDAAAALFGGTASQYAISTNGTSVGSINFSTWLDGWADGFTYASSGSPASQSYKLDTGGFGYNSNPGYQTAYSALVHDHYDGSNADFTNYAFLISGGVPEPATWALMISGFGLAGAALRRRRVVAA